MAQSNEQDNIRAISYSHEYGLPELRQQVNKLLDFFTEPGKGERYLKDLEDDLIQLILADRKQHELDARIEELEIYGGSVYVNNRISTLKHGLAVLKSQRGSHDGIE